MFDDTAIVNALISDNPSPQKQNLFKYDFGVFSYLVNDIGNPVQLYWNTNTMSVNTDDLKKQDAGFVVHYQNGYFELIKRKINCGNNQYLIAALVPIQWQYPQESKYLKSGFAGITGTGENYSITEYEKGIPVKNAKGTVVCSIEENDQSVQEQPASLPTLFRILAVVLFALFINALARDIVAEKGFFKGFAFLFLVIFFLRLLTYYFAFPFNFRNYDLFDPLSFIYSSSSLHPSLGDLLLNSILFFWLLSFVKLNNAKLFKRDIRLSAKTRNIIAATALFALSVAAFAVSNLVTGLITDSKKISFDVTDFFGLNLYTVIGFIIICFLFLSFFNLSHLLFRLSFQSQITRFWRAVILASSALLLLSLQLGTSSAGLNLIIIAWLIAYMLLIEFRKQDISVPLLNSSFFLLWAIFLVASATALVIYQNENFELQQRKTIAEKINDMPTDGGRAILDVTNFSNEFLEKNFNRFYNIYANKFIKDSIANENFSGYLSKYDIRIYTYDNENMPLYNEDSTSYFAIKGIIFSQGKVTSDDGLYYYENNSDRYSYIYEKQVKGYDSAQPGSLFVVVKPKVYKSEALIPELFRKENDVASDLSNYSYAVYNKGHIIRNFGDYSFSDSVLHTSNITEFDYAADTKNGYSEMWYNAGQNKIVCVVKKDNWFVESLTLFAYIFCMFIALAALLHFGTLLIGTRFKKEEIQKVFRFNIRTQIQATIITIILFSFIVIGIATISFFISEFNKDSKDKLDDNAKIMVNEIEERIHSELVFDDMFNLNDFNLTGGIERKIAEIAGVHNIDINFYDLAGNLEVSTQHEIYGNQILSGKMEPAAFSAMHDEHRIEITQEERIGAFKYLSIYVPVRDESGAPLAYLNVPYLNAQTELSQEISSFLVTLIDLNALIFILAGAIAIMVTSRITSSFTLIGNRMKQISLGKMNEEIVWKSNDELGILVDEYNKMVQKLGQSAEALARSEREGAWREMARQVAHEIKNPLTPMKLSIQYLQKAINNNAPNVKELSQQVANTLIEQIEQLSKIAGDFSQFANIANVNIVNFDISEVLASLVNLFSADSNVHIQWIKDAGRYIICADKIQMNRLFTNLLKNSMEAAQVDGRIDITIEQRRKGGSVMIAVADNGTGIPQNMREKIFTPNFTTKSSGTGLGLAICKGIVENANGHISFITEEENGTTFFVELPLAE